MPLKSVLPLLPIVWLIVALTLLKLSGRKAGLAVGLFQGAAARL